MSCHSKIGTRTASVEKDTWLFAFDSSDSGNDQRWYSDSCDRTRWILTKSGFWSDENGIDYDGVGWYASTFEIVDPSQYYTIFFGRVDDDVDVWVNGTAVGSHTGPDEDFFLALRQLRRGLNTVVLRVTVHGGQGGLFKPVQIIRSSEVTRLLKSGFGGMNARPSPDWVRNAVIYEVYLRSFSKEGTFKGLEQKLPELKALGVTVVWLMPIHPIGELGRKGELGSPYSVQDYYAVNPAYGTLDDFKSLVSSVHRLGLKIIIDLVANHTSWDSKLLFEHPEWFKKNNKGAIVSPNADWTDVAQLDYRQHELRKYMINVMTYWVRDAGIDGFRCDVADFVPLDFWETARAELDRIKPVVMIAEGKDPDDHLKAFDLTYSWNLYEAMDDVVRRKRSVEVFDELLSREKLKYPKNALRMRFISNHDKNVQDEPAVQQYTLAGARATAVLAFTYPGVPLIYNGEEAGNIRKLSLVKKVTIDWSNGKDYRNLYSKLAQLRDEHPALRQGDYRKIWCSDSTRVYAFERSTGDDVVDVVINFSKARRIVTIESTNELFDIFKNKTLSSENKNVTLDLPSYGYSILTPTGNEERQ